MAEGGRKRRDGKLARSTMWLTMVSDEHGWEMKSNPTLVIPLLPFSQRPARPARPARCANVAYSGYCGLLRGLVRACL